MLCKKNWKKGTSVLVLCLGAVSFTFGLLTYLIARPEEHSLNTLLGMFTGFGFGIIAVAGFMLVRSKVVSPQKLMQEEIEREDERNIAISRAAGLVGFFAGVGLFAVLAFVFMGLGYRVPSFVCVGGIYVLVAGYLVARRVYAKKM